MCYAVTLPIKCNLVSQPYLDGHRGEHLGNPSLSRHNVRAVIYPSLARYCTFTSGVSGHPQKIIHLDPLRTDALPTVDLSPACCLLVLSKDFCNYLYTIYSILFDSGPYLSTYTFRGGNSPCLSLQWRWQFHRVEPAVGISSLCQVSSWSASLWPAVERRGAEQSIES